MRIRPPRDIYDVLEWAIDMVALGALFGFLIVAFVILSHGGFR